uniref:COP1-interacting protein 7 n=2 Tax=Kalanchoe fedtschenkoi TaxID=63787 RepID=A0A7N0TH66_KALFE
MDCFSCYPCICAGLCRSDIASASCTYCVISCSELPAVVMDGEADDRAILKYVRFQIWPKQNRYRAFACDGYTDEILFEGLLEQLTQHLPQVQEFYSGGAEANLQLRWPRSSSAAAWFSKSTFRRFLSIANSAELFNEIKAIEDEMSQLEKARKFHLSLYSQGHQHVSGSGKADGGNPNSAASQSQSESEVEIVASDPSKNELLRAMDSRLKALRDELAVSFQQAVGSLCGSEDISLMVYCCQNLGAMALKKYLIKYSELSQIKLTLDNASDEKPTFVNAVGSDDEIKTGADRAISNLGQPVVLVQYGGSTAEAAQAESDNTRDNADSSEDSDVDTSERSRSLVRSATPRRSASPMRRVQIARVGSRRAAAIGIKSLNYFPVRERTLSHGDEPAKSSDEEACGKPLRKPEANVQRMSVQAAISLFESKQREENADIQKKSLGDIPKNAKPVLRKWNSRVEQTRVQCSAEAVTENNSLSSSANLQGTETQEVERQEPESGIVNINTHQDGEIGSTMKTSDSFESYAPETLENIMSAQEEESTERQTASAKWNQQKEAELSMLMKMIEGKPVKPRRPAANQINTTEQRGGFYDDYKKKRDEKLRGENAAKRAEKEAQFKAMQQIIEKSKVDMPSKDSRRQSLRKSLPSATPRHSVNPKKESPKDIKHTTAKRGAMKASSLPITRKSWPSSPPPQATGTSPSTNLTSAVASSTATRRKSQPPQSLARANPKVEKPLLQKNAKELRTESRTSSKGAIVMQRQPGTRDSKPTKPKSLASSEDFSDMVPAKSGLPTKGAKKSSIVPVESKPFLRKGSKVGSAVSPATNKSKSSPRSKESVRKSGNTSCSLKKEVAVHSPEQVDKHEIKELIHDHAEPALVTNILVNSDKKITDPESPCKDDTIGSINFGVVGYSSTTIEKEDATISPSAWVEIEESHDPPIMPIPIDDSEVQFAYPASIASVEIASPRMRQSLSQMMLEESNELENNTEWGNVEHPPVFYQKDAPKGLKRLLNFARKSKGDGNSSGWSSPSVFSEGDDDTDDYKTAFQKNTDNRLRKATYQSKSTSQLKSLLSDGVDRKDSSGKQTHEISSADQRSSNQFGEGHNSVGVSGARSSRSFFSLSAFRGGK